MPDTLFDLEDAREPRSVTLDGFALLYDLTEPVRRIGQVCPIRWHLDPESICETREQIESYRASWCDENAASPVIVRVKVECVEVVT